MAALTMCGIAGLVFSKNSGSPTFARDIRAMCDRVRHRGPDGEGYALFSGTDVWLANGPDTPELRRSIGPERRPVQVALGHRRLSIVDLSHAGHQPMCDEGQRYWLTYNGEIYNYVELRVELETLGHRFVSETDTEVLLAAYSQWGLACLARFNGMFAFVLYDRQARRLLAVRDRFGVKPLYMWSAPDGTLAFASEIKQFTVLPGWRASLDGQAAYDHLVMGLTDHAGRSLFRGVTPLPPGTYVEVELDKAGQTPAPRAWYSLPVGPTIDGNEGAICEQWRALFVDAVRLRLRSDVPVGTALSGGLDSSSIVCAVHALRGLAARATQNAFSARTHDPAFDEGLFMDEVVRRTGVDHHSVWPEPEDLFARLPDLTWHMDEPFGSTSVFAEWRVFETVASTDVKVTLDGHGGDEILAGYRVYPGAYLGNLLRRGRLTAMARETAALISKGGHAPLNLAALLVDDVAPSGLRNSLRRVTGRATLHPDWIDIERLGAAPVDPYSRGEGISGLSRSQLTATSLPMQLRWNDRNSMAFSIESRAPFLDVRLVELTLALTDKFKIAGGRSKWILREALAGLVPPTILARRDKMGFVTPEANWARGPQAESFRTLSQRAIDRAGGILTGAAGTLADDMISGRRPYNALLWRMISFGVWLDRFDVATE